MKSSGLFLLPLAVLSMGSEARPSGLNETAPDSFRVCNPRAGPGFGAWSITARCPGPDGELKIAGINFGSCLFNIDGELRGGHGDAFAYLHFIKTCDWIHASLAGTVYNCRCKDTNGRWVKNSIDLEGIITSRNGALHCYTEHGSSYYLNGTKFPQEEKNQVDPNWELLSGQIWGEKVDQWKAERVRRKGQQGL